MVGTLSPIGPTIFNVCVLGMTDLYDKSIFHIEYMFSITNNAMAVNYSVSKRITPCTAYMYYINGLALLL